MTVDGGTPVNPASVDFHASDADTITLTMNTADAIAAGETVSVDYTKPTANPLKDGGGQRGRRVHRSGCEQPAGRAR